MFPNVSAPGFSLPAPPHTPPPAPGTQHPAPSTSLQGPRLRGWVFPRQLPSLQSCPKNSFISLSHFRSCFGLC